MQRRNNHQYIFERNEGVLIYMTISQIVSLKVSSNVVPQMSRGRVRKWRNINKTINNYQIIMQCYTTENTLPSLKIKMFYFILI